jgi:hypothetical protein
MGLEEDVSPLQQHRFLKKKDTHKWHLLASWAHPTNKVIGNSEIWVLLGL